MTSERTDWAEFNKPDSGPKITIDKNGIFQRVGYAPHEGQRPVHAARSRHRFLTVPAGRRFGKSELGGHELTVAAHVAYAQRKTLEPKGKRHEYWIVGPTYSDAEKEFRKFYNDLVRLGIPMDHPGTYYSEMNGSNQVSLFGGRFLVTTKSAERPDTLVGEGLMGVILAEAAKLKHVVWTKSIRPTLADYANEGSWALLTSTPEGKNWFYDQYMRGQDPNDPQWWSQRAPSWINNVLFPGGRFDPEIIEMERDMTAEKFKQEIGADFTDFVGRVFKQFEEETHVGDYPFNPKLPTYIAQDHGFRNPAVIVFLQVDVFDNVFVVGEYYKTHRTPEEIAQDILDDPKLRQMANAARHLFPDPATPSTSATQAKAWNVQEMPDTGGPLNDRLDLIRRWLKPAPYELEDGHPEKIPKFLVDRHCPNTIREFNDYRYPETRNEQGSDPSEKPMKKDDHVPEAVGRFFAGHFGQKFIETEKTRQSKARMRSRR